MPLVDGLIGRARAADSAPFYGVYETRDAKFMAVGAIEPQFWSELVSILDLDPETTPAQTDRGTWCVVSFAECASVSLAVSVAVDRLVGCPSG